MDTSVRSHLAPRFQQKLWCSSPRISPTIVVQTTSRFPSYLESCSPGRLGGWPTQARFGSVGMFTRNPGDRRNVHRFLRIRTWGMSRLSPSFLSPSFSQVSPPESQSSIKYSLLWQRLDRLLFSLDGK